MNTKNLSISKESAGSGKTFHLSHRYIDYLLQEPFDPLAYKRILAVTFTNAATSEMKERILKYLNTGDKDGNIALKKEILRRIVHDYSMFKVSTIDSFFQSVIRSFALELGRRNSYELTLDGEEAVQESLNSLYKTVKNNPSLVKTLEKIALEGVDNEKYWDFRNRIADFCSKILQDEFLTVRREEPELFEKLSENDLKEREAVIAEMEKYCSSFIDKLYEVYCRMGEIFAASRLESSDFFKKTTSSVFKFLNSAAVTYKNRTDNPTAPLKNIPVSSEDKFFEWYDDFENKWLPKKAGAESAAALRALYDAVHPLATRLLELLNSCECRYCYSYLSILDNIKETSLLGDVYSELKDYCDREGVALIAETPDLIHSLIGEAKDAPFIYEKTGSRIDHFLLDEFQDTSSVQWSNFSPLIQESLSKNFENLIVGDVKQSIYRWRGGDWRILNSGLEKLFKESVKLDSKGENNGRTTNYRSLTRIVEFNNRIFEKLPALIDSQYEDRSDRPFTETDSLSHIYADCLQNVSKQNSERGNRGQNGFVKVISFPHMTGRSTNSRVLNEDIFICRKTLQIIQSLTDEQRAESKRYKRGQIALLVDTKEHGRALVDYLMLNGIKVVSGEAALIDSSDAVFTLLVLLRSLSTHDMVWTDILESLYDVKIENKDQLFNISLNDSVYDICRTLTENHLPKDMLKDVVFLTAFADKLHQYSVKEGSDVPGFLKWWEQGREDFTIPTPRTEDAVTVMTMHKAKGLAFDVVLIPYIKDYKDSQTRMKTKSSHWVKCEDPAFIYKNRALVRFRDVLLKTVFEKDFEKEKYNIVIDCVNLLYVSFTRAKEKLYVFDAFQGGEDSLTGKLYGLCNSLAEGDVSSFSKSNFSYSVQDALQNGFDEEEIVNPEGKAFEFDEITYGNENDDIADWHHEADDVFADALAISEITPRYMFNSVRNELRISNFGSDDDARHQGILLHLLYSYLNYCSPEDAVNKLFETSPSVSVLKKTKEELISSVKDNLSKVAEYEWFNIDKYRPYAESDILFKGGFYRPDRVLVSADGSKAEAVVVDYKFGEIKAQKYNKQVAQYCKLLKDMGFAKVRGYLWYVVLKEVEEV